MGWRDINMNRRKPPLQLAAIPMAPGEDRTAAVLRHVVSRACEVLLAQREHLSADEQRFHPFIAGYLMGYARQLALAHGVECEAGGGTSILKALATEIDRQIGGKVMLNVSDLRFVPREAVEAGMRTALCATPMIADAGYLAGHLEALCGSRKLVSRAILRAMHGQPDAGQAYLTDCDIAADPMQTRAPTLSLRFTERERDVVRAAFAHLTS